MTVEQATGEMLEHARQMDKKGENRAAWAFRQSSKIVREKVPNDADEWDRERQVDECPGCHRVGELSDPPDLYRCTTDKDECGVAVFYAGSENDSKGGSDE